MAGQREEAPESDAKITATVEQERGASDSLGFGALLRHYRLAAGLSQDALAERARMSSDGISALERGHRRTPQHETLALLAGALALNDEKRRAFEVAAMRSGLGRRGAAAVTIGPWPGAGLRFCRLRRPVSSGERSSSTSSQRLCGSIGWSR